MFYLWLNLTNVFILSFFARYFSRNEISEELTWKLKFNKIFLFGVVLSLVVVAGFRSNIGDTITYMYSFETNNFTLSSVLKSNDIGFNLLQLLIKKYTDDSQLLIFITALITNTLIILILARYSKIFEISTYVYITGGLFLVSMNGIRQVLAAAIIFTATRFLISGNWVAYFFVVGVASSFHQSALILLPIFFLVRYKAWSKATIILLIFSVVIVIGYNQFSTILFSAIENTQYGHYSNFNEGGANMVRVVVYAAPILLAYFGREKLRIIFPSSDYIVNMALVGLVFMIISTQNWIFARFSIYFNLYQLILVSWVVKLFKEKEQRFVYYALIICYFVYYYYESLISLNIVYKSNFFGV